VSEDQEEPTPPLSADVIAEALERYERAAAFIRQGWVTRAELEREVLGCDAKPIYFSPFRNSLVVREGFAAEKRAAEERGRREWTEAVRRRLGLVTEVHRCWVWRSVGLWHWWCLRDSCGGAQHNLPSQPEAFARALAHARSFVPQPPKPEPWTELDVLAFEAAWDAVQEEQTRFAAALPVRMAEVTEQVNTALAGVLPDGLRFEWRADGE
jgi:hypothetical protein